MKRSLKILSGLLIFILLLSNSNIYYAKTNVKIIKLKKVYTSRQNISDILANKYNEILTSEIKNKKQTINLSSYGYNYGIANQALNKAWNKIDTSNVDKVYFYRIYNGVFFNGFQIKIEYKKEEQKQTQQTEEKQYSNAFDFFLDEKDKENISKLNYEIAKAIYEAKTSLYISSDLYFKDKSVLDKAIDEVMNRYSDFSYLKEVRYSMTQSGVTINFTYTLNTDEIIKMNTGLYDVVKNVASKIQRQMSNVTTNQEKVKIIHDYIVNNFKYDIDYLKTQNTAQYARDSHAYYALVNNKAICGGYASAFQRLAKYFGIEAIIVKGYAEGVPHAWNKVKIGDEWLNVDVTYDDPVVNGNTNINSIRYDYFLKTDYEFSKTHSF